MVLNFKMGVYTILGIRDKTDAGYVKTFLLGMIFLYISTIRGSNFVLKSVGPLV